MLRIPSEIEEGQFESLKIKETTFVAYRSDIYPSKNDVFFEENAVIYILEGQKLFSTSLHEVSVKKGDVLFVRQGYYLMSESKDVKYKSLVFFMDNKLLKDFVNHNLELFENNAKNNKPLPVLFKLTSNDSFGKYVETIMPYFQFKTKYLNQFLKLKVQELLLHLLEFDEKHDLKQVLLSINHNQKADIGDIVNAYYLKPLNLNEMARLSNRSLSVFKREFAAQFGTSPGKWIKEKKLQHAQLLLKNKMGNVAEIADAIGLENVSYFIQAFKTRFGVTPHSVK